MVIHTMNMKMVVFWDVEPHNLVDITRLQGASSPKTAIIMHLLFACVYSPKRPSYRLFVSLCACVAARVYSGCFKSIFDLERPYN
jgi:hypothetical protein